MLDKSRRLGFRIEKYTEPFLLLGIRIYMWSVFYFSGRLKFDNYLNDDWASTLFLFEEVHPVPFIPSNIAAIMGTMGELVLSSLLFFGLFSRFTAFGLLIMTGVIELSFQYNPSDSDYTTNPAHIMWALLLAVILSRGAGKFSLDRMIFRRGKL
jgi:putative oxidoreductase